MASYTLVNVLYDWLPNLVIGAEYNWGSKNTRHIGSIDIGTGIVPRIDKGRKPHRIGFGLFVSF